MLRDAALRTPVLYGQSALFTFTEHPTPLLQLNSPFTSLTRTGIPPLEFLEKL